MKSAHCVSLTAVAFVACALCCWLTPPSALAGDEATTRQSNSVKTYSLGDASAELSACDAWLDLKRGQNAAEGLQIALHYMEHDLPSETLMVEKSTKSGSLDEAVASSIKRFDGIGLDGKEPQVETIKLDGYPARKCEFLYDNNTGRKNIHTILYIVKHNGSYYEMTWACSHSQVGDRKVHFEDLIKTFRWKSDKK